MSRWKCTVAYDGSAYEGWQSQTRDTSVQEQIEKALYRLTGVKTSAVASGRTDAGVNARGQVFHFDSDREMSERKWQGAINALLPDDIHIMKVEKKDRRFHARFSVLSKQYDYRIHFGEFDVFTRTSAYQCPYKVDLVKMKEAAGLLVGTHDFTSFCSNPLSETPDQVRTLEAVDFRMENDMLTISYRGRGFLRYMVRMMTGALLEVGRGRIEPEHIRYMLEHPSKTAVRKNAHPEGLTLMHVSYFEVLAENREVMLRQVLPEDAITMEDLSPEADNYTFVQKKTQQVLGVLQRRNNAALWMVDGEALAAAQELLPELQAYEPELNVQIIIREHA